MATTQSLLRFVRLPRRLTTRSSLADGINLTRSPIPSLTIHPRPRVPPISASYNETIPDMDRAISLLAYLHPFINVLPYGGLLQSRFPVIASLTSPFAPLRFAYDRDPLVDFLVYIILDLVQENPRFTNFVRFNAKQAKKLDVMLIWPRVVQKLVGILTRGGGVGFVEHSNGAIFVLGCVAFVYAVLSCAAGRYPHILPFLCRDVDDEEHRVSIWRARNRREFFLRVAGLIIYLIWCILATIVLLWY